MWTSQQGCPLGYPLGTSFGSLGGVIQGFGDLATNLSLREILGRTTRLGRRSLGYSLSGVDPIIP